MMQITQTEHNQLVRRVADALSNFQPGEDAIAVLSRIYQENLPDKSPRQGKLMAEELIQWMSRFRGGYDAALSNPGGFSRYALTESLRELSLEDQCRVLHRILRQEKGMEPDIFPGPATQQQRDELLEEILQLLTVHTELPSPLEGDYERQQWTKLHCGEEMTLATTAMILYTMAKNGELSGLPRDLTLGQAALCVCTNDTQCQLLWAEANGYMTQSRVQTLMQVLSLTFKTLWLCAVIPIVLSAFVVEGTLAFTAGGLVTLGSMILLTSCAFREFHEMLAVAADMITEVPLKLQAFQSLPLEEDRAKDAPAGKQKLPTPEQLTEAQEADTEDDDLLFF